MARPRVTTQMGSFVYEWFPRLHRNAYYKGFFRKMLVSAVRVADDLADPLAGWAARTAEEIIRHAAGVMAGEMCEAALTVYRSAPHLCNPLNR
jgi:hypothetical protein